MRVVSSRSTTRASRTRRSGCGRTGRRSRRGTRARTSRSSCCTGPCRRRRRSRRATCGKLVAPLKQPLRTTLDGIRVTYVPFVAPPRPRSYPSWGAWAAPSLALALKTLKPFDLVHAHYAAPAGDAVRRLGKPDGGQRPRRRRARRGDEVGERPRGRRALAPGREARRSPTRRGSPSAAAPSARRTCASSTSAPTSRHTPPRGTDFVTVGNLIARKRHADVIRALPPGARYVVIGDGPERARLEQLAQGKDVVFRGALPPAQALEEARERRRVRAPQRRGGVRRRLHRGDGGRPARDRHARRVRPGGDRALRRRDDA